MPNTTQLPPEYIKMGSDGSRFNVSLTVRDKNSRVKAGSNQGPSVTNLAPYRHTKTDSQISGEFNMM